MKVVHRLAHCVSIVALSAHFVLVQARFVLVLHRYFFLPEEEVPIIDLLQLEILLRQLITMFF